MKHILPFIPVLFLFSCSTQYKEMQDGTRLVNHNVLAQGMITVNEDGSATMYGNSEKAVDAIVSGIRWKAGGEILSEAIGVGGEAIP